MRSIFTTLVFILSTSVVIYSSGEASDVFHHHDFKAGETVKFIFEDTDTIFSAASKDGRIQAGDPSKIQEIQIPVSIGITSKGKELVRTLTISPDSQYRSSDPSNIGRTLFEPLVKLSKIIPSSISYSYKNDTSALDHLQGAFVQILGKSIEEIRKDEIAGFLFFKTEDIHQMQESTEKIPEGMAPGQLHVYPGGERKGLGGKFIAAPAQLIYQGTEVFNGTKAGYFKVISLGHEFLLPSMKTYTNFFFTMHVALEGPRRGLLLFGEGQETATVLKDLGGGKTEPLALLQRQFSIRLRK
jgi:hypothetical protein